MKPGVLIIVGCCMVLLCGSAALAQSEMPLAITGSSREAGAQSTVVQLRNDSDKKITAYALTAEYFADSTAKPVWKRAKLVITSGALPDATSPSILPGQTWTETLDGSPADVKGGFEDVRVAVDFVLLEDGSRFGPDKAKQSFVLEGMIRGSAIARRQGK